MWLKQKAWENKQTELMLAGEARVRWWQFAVQRIWTPPGSGCQEKNIIHKKKCLSLGHKVLELEHDTVRGQGQGRAYLTHASPGPDSASVRGLSAAGDRNPNSRCQWKKNIYRMSLLQIWEGPRVGSLFGDVVRTQDLFIIWLCLPWSTKYVLRLVAKWWPPSRGPEEQEPVSSSECLLCVGMFPKAGQQSFSHVSSANTVAWACV